MTARIGRVARPRGRRRGVELAVALLALAGVGAVLVVPAGAATAPAVPASQALVVLLRDHVVRTAPGATAHRVEVVGQRRPLTHGRTVLPVLGRATTGAGSAWVRVRLPGRPSGHTGWISADATVRRATEWRLAVDLSARRVTVWRDGRIARTFRAVVGKPATPTPRGRFFVEESVALRPTQSGSPFALALSARSNVLQEFDGGPGQIALHGLGGLRGAPGSAVSHGCVRLTTPVITWLAARIGAGVPVTIAA